MALFYTGDGVFFTYSDLGAAKRFWIDTFGCKETKVPANWDCILPSDVALRLPGEDEPGIGLSDRAEVESAGYERTNARAIIYCRNIRKAHEHLAAWGAKPATIGELGGMQFFEIKDCEGNTIEICLEA